MSLSLYIHIPFCKSRCPYCSFVSFEQKDEVIGPYLAALDGEASFYKGRDISTIYIGGGTPTYLSETDLESLFARIRANFNINALAEWTIEANPATFDSNKAAFLRGNGVTRVSLGIQSFNDRFLKFLGRPYDRLEALKAHEVLRKTGFRNISIDLMYAFPLQNEEDLACDVEAALALRSEHISLYALTVPPETAFYRSGIKPLDDDGQADYYRRICSRLAEAGWTQYEVSNFAKKDHECKHNLNYWRGGEYIGLGVSAHSHLKGARFWNTSDLVHYNALIQRGVLPKAGQEVLSPEEKLLEVLLIGLRLTQGVDIKKLEMMFRVTLNEEKKLLINDCIKGGLLRWEEGCLKTTLPGILVLDGICAKII